MYGVERRLTKKHAAAPPNEAKTNGDLKEVIHATASEVAAATREDTDVMENALETDFNAVAAEKNKDAAAADAQDETSQGSTHMAALVAVATRQIGATWRVMRGGRGMCAQGYPASGCRRGP